MLEHSSPEDALQTTSEQIKKNMSDSKIVRIIKGQIAACSNYQAINNTDDVFFVFPESFDLIKEDPLSALIKANEFFKYNHDGAINPLTWQGYKIPNGFSVTITKTGVDKDGHPKYKYYHKNEVPYSHPFSNRKSWGNTNI